MGAPRGVSEAEREGIVAEARLAAQSAAAAHLLDVDRRISTAVGASETRTEGKIEAAVWGSERKCSETYCTTKEASKFVTEVSLSERLGAARYVEDSMMEFHLQPYAKAIDIPDVAGLTRQCDSRLLALEKEVLLPDGRLAALARRPGTDQFELRVHGLEKEVLAPEGRLAGVEGRIDSIEQCRVGDR